MKSIDDKIAVINEKIIAKQNEFIVSLKEIIESQQNSIDLLFSELDILKNPSDGRCMDIAAMRTKLSKLEKFLLDRCFCGSIPGPQTCSYCEVVNGPE